MTENNGVLALNGQDLGPKVREFFHTDEYEYFYRVPAPYKNTLLLYLLKEKFEGEIRGRLCVQRLVGRARHSVRVL